MGKSAKDDAITGGTIQTDKISEAHNQIRTIVRQYNSINAQVTSITNKVRENWVGEGRNEFESQYNLLIKKIDDFGDVLEEIYDALVEAEAEYETQDTSLMQDFVKSLQG